MLSRKDLIESMDKQYEPMLKLVSIADFTKCIAQFAGLEVKEVSDSAIREYLQKWAKNKFKYFEMLGNKLVLDFPIEYEQFDDDKESEFEIIKRQHPGFIYWIDTFKHTRKNKINLYDLRWSERDTIEDLFPNDNIDNTSITHFFKRQLQAPDELVTAIGRIYENDKIMGKYAISIDPVDMMLASENPYNWNSCYRLAVPNDSSHADGCLAAILDDTSLITYIWDKEGKFKLQNGLELKNARWKRMRRWIAISPDMDAIHFNSIYPGKDSYPKEFRQQLREIVEKLICDYNDVYNLWTKDCYSECNRDYLYGYGEYSCDRIWKLKDYDSVSWTVFNEQIVCPCGCGYYLPGADWDEDECEGESYWEYNGDGFIYENFSEREKEYWCNYADEYCSHECCAENCEDCGCMAWENAHPVCELDTDQLCDGFDWDCTPLDVNDGVVSPEKEHCSGCPLYRLHCHKDEEQEEKEEEAGSEAVVPTAAAKMVSVIDRIEDGRVYMTTTRWQTDPVEEMWREAHRLEEMQEAGRKAQEEQRIAAERNFIEQMTSSYGRIIYGDGRDE